MVAEQARVMVKRCLTNGESNHYFETLFPPKPSHPARGSSWPTVTTLTVNRNYATTVHKDEGDYRQGFGVLAALRRGAYTGGFFGLPEVWGCCRSRKPRCAAGRRPRVPRQHAPSRRGRYERISLVLYYRAGMADCG